MRRYLASAWLPMRRYAEFSGRSQPQEFWAFTLVITGLTLLCDVIDELAGLSFDGAGWAMGATGVAGAVFSLVTLIPFLAVAVRRVHDTNLRGWWLLPPLAANVACFIALGAMFGIHDFPMEREEEVAVLTLGFLGTFLLLIVLLCRKGTAGPNRFGDDPQPTIDYDDVFN